MIFTFDAAAGSDTMTLKGDTFKYLIKVRRHQAGEALAFRHPDAPLTLHRYTIDRIDGRQAYLTRTESTESVIAHPHPLHLGWCAVDPKSVEKVLPLLNELGVAKITFIRCERSQKDFRPDFNRYERILHASMQQCGRSVMMELEEAGSVSEFLQRHPDAVVLDFAEQRFDTATMRPETVLIGPEGGWCDAERSVFGLERIYRLAVPTVLRSETAAVALSSAILL